MNILNGGGTDSVYNQKPLNNQGANPDFRLNAKEEVKKNDMSINKTLNSIFSPQFGLSGENSMSSLGKVFGKTTRVKTNPKQFSA